MQTRLSEYRLHIDEGTFRAECYFPGVTYDDFDRAGNLSPWKVCRMLEAGRAVPFRHGNYLDFLELIKGGGSTYFVLGGNYSFDPCLWAIGRGHRYFPYKITTELVNVGQTSVTIREVLTNLNDNKEVASFTCTLVYVDRTSRRPQTFPSWHRMKYQSHSRKNETIDVPTTGVPDTAYTRTFMVTASDTDLNGHTNQAAYIRYCLDTAEQARRENRLPNISTDVCLYPIAKISVLYRGETLSGDKLCASVWEHRLNPVTLHFVISRHGETVFLATFDFRERVSSKL